MGGAAHLEEGDEREGRAHVHLRRRQRAAGAGPPVSPEEPPLGRDRKLVRPATLSCAFCGPPSGPCAQHMARACSKPPQGTGSLTSLHKDSDHQTGFQG